MIDGFPFLLALEPTTNTLLFGTDIGRENLENPDRGTRDDGKTES